MLPSPCLSFFEKFQITNIITTVDVSPPLKIIFNQNGVLEMVMPHPKGVM